MCASIQIDPTARPDAHYTHGVFWSRYLHGFPIGYEDESAASSTNLFNHVTIVVKTHRTNEESVRIVGFEIKAGSFAAKVGTMHALWFCVGLYWRTGLPVLTALPVLTLQISPNCR